ncbi:hypothetical protein ACTXT7_011387 [Hymenolepis weldensis]
MPKPKVSQVSRQLVDFLKLIEMYDCLPAEVKDLPAKFEGPKYVNSSITRVSSVPSSYSNKPSASVIIPDPGSAVSTGGPVVCLRVCTWIPKRVSIITPRLQQQDMTDVQRRNVVNHHRLVDASEVSILLDNLLSSSIGVNSTEKQNIKGTIATDLSNTPDSSNKNHDKDMSRAKSPNFS